MSFFILKMQQRHFLGKIILDRTTEIKPIRNAPTNVYPTHYYVPVKGLETIQTTSTFTGLSKCQHLHKDEDSENAQKDMRVNKKVKSRPTTQHKLNFKGFVWSEHSYAYDGLLTILLVVYPKCKAV